jgi:hypothetical protein
LREVRKSLREGGVLRVIAEYGHSLIVAFLDAEDRPILPTNVERMSNDLAEVLVLVLKRRGAALSPKEKSSGTFDWQLDDDTLEHRHSVTFNGL